MYIYILNSFFKAKTVHHNISINASLQNSAKINDLIMLSLRNVHIILCFYILVL